MNLDNLPVIHNCVCGGAGKLCEVRDVLDSVCDARVATSESAKAYYRVVCSSCGRMWQNRPLFTETPEQAINWWNVGKDNPT
jgi:hypothetical protein